MKKSAFNLYYSSQDRSGAEKKYLFSAPDGR